MEVSKKKFGLALALTAILCFSLGYSLTIPRPKNKPEIEANVFIFVETLEGKYEASIHNVITNIGEKYVRDILGFDNVTNHNATKWISLSNTGSPSVTWTQLDTEVNANGFTRALGSVVSWMNGTDYAYNVTKKFTASGTQQLKNAGLQWSGVALSDNNLFACAGFTQTTFNANDNCTIRWVITINAN